MGKLTNLALLGAVVYAVKKYLDDNPAAKRQAKEYADQATAQAKHAAEQWRSRQGGPDGSPTGSTTPGAPAA